MTQNKYIGAEQEFVSFNKLGMTVRAGSYFNRIKSFEKDYLEKSDTAIRTKTGHAMYVDGSEIEVCTPPVRINRGFATRLTDLIMIGREKIVKAVPDVSHTGLSMHWNLSEPQFSSSFYSGIAIPFHLFGLTPLSKGLNVRLKDDDASGQRAEILGDALTSEDQINATALMLGAYSYAIQNEGAMPLFIGEYGDRPSTGSRTGLFLPDGRFSPVDICLQDGNRQGGERKRVQAQLALEYFYESIRPFAKKIGTKEEMENLAAFIYGDKRLEFDKFKFFACLREYDGKVEGTYQPIKLGKGADPNKVIVLSGKDRTLPLEGRLLGSFIGSARSMLWGEVCLGGTEGKRVSGLDEIYDYASSLSGEKEKLQNSPVLRRLDASSPNKTEIIQRGPKKYTPSEDRFESPTFNMSKGILRKFKSFLFSNLGLATVGLVAVGMTCISYLSNDIYNKILTDRRVDSIVEKYSPPKTNTVSQVILKSPSGAKRP